MAQRVVYGLFRGIGCLLVSFPESWIPGLAKALGFVLRSLDRKHARMAADNVLRAGFRVGARRLVRRVYEHFCTVFLEVLRLPRIAGRTGPLRRARMENWEIYRRELKRGKGVILVLPHLGNWEVAGVAAPAAGIPLNTVARPLDNAYLERWLTSVRTLRGQIMVSKFHCWDALVGVLRRGGVVCMLNDQAYPGSGVEIEFFGRPAWTAQGTARLSLEVGSPIVPMEIYRDCRRVHHIACTEAIRAEDYRADPDPVRSITQAFTARFEGFIRAHPEQWLWLHNRWKTPGPKRLSSHPVSC